MSQCLDLRISKKVSREKIHKEIKRLGFVFIDKDFYKFFEKKDFLSFSGVELYTKYLTNRTVISTRTAGLRNYYDIEKQNHTIKNLKGIFGGYIKNDDGSRSYVSGRDDMKLSVVERACGLAYHYYYGSIFKSVLMISTLKIPEYTPYISELNGPTKLGNLIIPYFISGLEDFLRTFFIRYINHSPKYKIKGTLRHEDKLTHQQIQDISKGILTLGEIISREYSFQNLGSKERSVIVAYKDHLMIDLKKILSVRKKIRSGKRPHLWSYLKKAIEDRHKIIHENMFIYYSKEDLETFRDVFDLIGKTIVVDIEKRDKVRLRLNDL